MSTEKALQILVVADETNPANQLISLLREEGLGVRADSAADAESFSEYLNRRPDLIFFYEGCNKLTPEHIIAELRQRDYDCPLFCLPSEDSQLQALSLLKQGAEAVIDSDDHESLSLSVKRGLEALQLRREKRRLEVALRNLEQRQALLLESTRDAFCYLQEGIQIYCNPSYVSLLGYQDSEDLLNRPILDLLAPEDYQRFKGLISDPLKGRQELQVKLKHREGFLFPAAISLVPVLYGDTPSIQVALKPAPGNQAHGEQLKQLEDRDLLTSLLTPDTFKEKLEDAIATALNKDQYSSLLVIKLDKFVDIESTIGKTSANMVLADISRFLREGIQKSFLACRLDLSEFALLLYDADPQEAINLSAFIKSKINNRITETSLPSLKLSASIGMALINGNALDASDIISRARNNSVTSAFSSVKKSDSHHQFKIGAASDIDIQDMIHYLETALAQDRFKLAFQPIVNMQQEKPGYYEVLLRMLDEQDNEISPSEFIPIANLNGIGEKIDRWILSRTIDLLKKASSDSKLIINITHNGMISRQFLPWANQQLQEARLAADQLSFQVSEVDIFKSLEQAVTFFEGLEALNLQRNITHFGAVLEPFNYLTNLKPNMVKLDEMLSRDITYSPLHQSKLKATIDRLHDNNIQVVAPMVENMDLLPLLWELGVDFVQGYCLQAPSHEMNYEFIQAEEITLDAFNNL